MQTIIIIIIIININLIHVPIYFNYSHNTMLIIAIGRVQALLPIAIS